MKCDKCGVDSDAHQEAIKQYEANCLVPLEDNSDWRHLFKPGEMLHKPKDMQELNDLIDEIFERVKNKYFQPAKKSPSTNKIMDILNELCGEPRAQKLKIARAIKQLIDEKE